MGSLRRQLLRRAAVLAALCWVGCVGKQDIEPYTEHPCPRASEGNSCVTFNYSITPDARKAAKGTMKGILRWAVYKGGDVTLFGPGNNRSMWGDDEFNTDLSMQDASVDVVIDDVPSGRYQVLAYLDEDGDDNNDSGEVATFPKEPFGIPPNRDITVKILFDFVR